MGVTLYILNQHSQCRNEELTLSDAPKSHAEQEARSPDYHFPCSSLYPTHSARKDWSYLMTCLLSFGDLKTWNLQHKCGALPATKVLVTCKWSILFLPVEEQRGRRGWGQAREERRAEKSQGTDYSGSYRTFQILLVLPPQHYDKISKIIG